MSANDLHVVTANAQAQSEPVRAPAVSLNPAVAPADADSAYWIAQVTLRLRREICWCWHQRAGHSDPRSGVAPPCTDAAQDSLDLTRYQNDKQRFLHTDVTARYLTEQLAAIEPPARESTGFWRRAATQAGLDAPAQFVLALALSARVDASLGPVFAACHNDVNRPFPTLAIAQRLWDDPLAIVACAGASHPLFRYGLLSPLTDSAHGTYWQQPLDMPGLVAQALLDPDVPLPPMLQLVALPANTGSTAAAVLPGLAPAPLEHMQVIALNGPRGADFVRFAAVLVSRARAQDPARRLVKIADDFAPERGALAEIATACWLHRCDAVLPEHWSAQAAEAHEHKSEHWFAPVLSIPVRWFAPCDSIECCKTVPPFARARAFTVPGLDHAQRVECFASGLGAHAVALGPALAEAAKRFRCEERTIAAITRSFDQDAQSVSRDALFTACRTAVANELEHLAQRVQPRFRLDELVLPAPQAMQLAETVRAMRALATVHYDWGTAQAWYESGLSVLFCGPPGTGKTMAAEALACELDLPMYRVDLSQVVNKYIGETEKNLKRIFDAVELSDCVLLFDEADALFGKRTEVKDAHDRFANIEISYLLERMERFKGLAVLATNRRKDLDEAFTRRLRFIVEFPLPGAAERERIWRRVFPAAVDVGELDFAYLARAFQLAGGHLRSIAFNACLMAAACDERPRVRMREVLVAVKRELDKMNRPASRETFGSYAELIAEYLA